MLLNVSATDIEHKVPQEQPFKVAELNILLSLPFNLCVSRTHKLPLCHTTPFIFHTGNPCVHKSDLHPLVQILTNSLEAWLTKKGLEFSELDQVSLRVKIKTI